MWLHTGRTRPAFAETPQPGQESVWDYPRPPRLQADRRTVVVAWRGIEIARSARTLRICETASPPVFYLPPNDVRTMWLNPAPGGSFCEWKGEAAYWTVRLPDGSVIDSVGWSYPQPKPAFEGIAGWFSFYPARLDCSVDGEPARPQGGGFYGGWVTDEIVGPWKGGAGTSGW